MKHLPTLQHVITAALAYVGFVCALLSTLLVYFSLVPPAPPVHFSSPAETVAWQGIGSTIVRHRREMLAVKDLPVTALRSVTCTVGGVQHLFELPAATYLPTPGSKISLPLVASLPMMLPMGTVCELDTRVRWSPTFALKDFYHSLPSEQFLIGAQYDPA